MSWINIPDDIKAIALMKYDNQPEIELDYQNIRYQFSNKKPFPLLSECPIDKQGQYHGTYKWYHLKKGILLYECEYVHGTKDGKQIEYFFNSNIKVEGFIRSVFSIGEEKGYYQDGRIRWHVYWEDIPNGQKIQRSFEYAKKHNLPGPWL